MLVGVHETLTEIITGDTTATQPVKKMNKKTLETRQANQKAIPLRLGVQTKVTTIFLFSSGAKWREYLEILTQQGMTPRITLRHGIWRDPFCNE
jgi:hypothetical protein